MNHFSLFALLLSVCFSAKAELYNGSLPSLSRLDLKGSSLLVTYKNPFKNCLALYDSNGQRTHSKALFCVSVSEESKAIPVDNFFGNALKAGNQYKLCQEPSTLACSSLFALKDITVSPKITSISPTYFGSATKVQISGNNLKETKKVTFAGATANFKVVNEELVEAISPEYVKSGKIEITTLDGKAESAPYQAFEILSVEPNKVFGGATVTVKTTPLVKPKLYIDSSSPPIKVVSDTEIKLTLAEGVVPGTKPITIISGSSTVLSSPKILEVLPQPVVEATNAKDGEQGSVFTMTGRDFLPSTRVFFPNNLAAETNVFSSTQLNVKVPKGATSGPLEIRHPGVEGTKGSFRTLANFEVLPTPVITGIAPSAGSPGMQVSIVGENLSGISSVSFGAQVATKFTSISSKELRAVVPEGATTGNVILRFTRAAAVSPAAFRVNQTCSPHTKLEPQTCYVANSTVATQARFCNPSGSGVLTLGCVAQACRPGYSLNATSGTCEANGCISGKLDNQFGQNGVLEMRELYVRSLLPLPDRGFLAVGSSDDAVTAIAKYTESGQLDRSFGKGGLVKIYYPDIRQSWGLKIVVQTDGKFLVLSGLYSSRSFGLARLMPTGSLDLSFAKEGMLTDDLNIPETTNYDPKIIGVGILPDGKIVVGGKISSTFLTKRYFPDGRPDTTYTVSGKAYALNEPKGNLNATSGFFLQKDGKVLLGGSQSIVGSPYPRPILTRLDINGAPDSKFGVSGLVFEQSYGANDSLSGFVVDSKGTLSTSVALRGNPKIGRARYGSNGAFSSRLETVAGTTPIGGAEGVAVQSNDVVLYGAYENANYSSYLYRVESAGAPGYFNGTPRLSIPNFSIEGLASDDAGSKIIVFGTENPMGDKPYRSIRRYCQ